MYHSMDSRLIAEITPAARASQRSYRNEKEQSIPWILAEHYVQSRSLRIHRCRRHGIFIASRKRRTKHGSISPPAQCYDQRKKTQKHKRRIDQMDEFDSPTTGARCQAGDRVSPALHTTADKAGEQIKPSPVVPAILNQDWGLLYRTG
jgi:hypothetical protein